jgi:hypothetical protein
MLTAINPDEALANIPPTQEILHRLAVASRVCEVLRKQLRACKLADQESPRRRQQKEVTNAGDRHG